MLKTLAVEADVTGRDDLKSSIAPDVPQIEADARHPAPGAAQPGQERRSGDARRRQADDCQCGRPRTAASRFAWPTPAWAFPPENLAKIFDLYFTTKQQGTGIGLSLVYRTIQLHNGDIDVESTPGVGTTFIIKMPKRRGAQLGLAARSTASLDAPNRNVSAGPRPARRAEPSSYSVESSKVRPLQLLIVVALAASLGACAKARAHTEPRDACAGARRRRRRDRRDLQRRAVPTVEPSPSTRRWPRRRRVRRRARPPPGRAAKARARAHRARAAGDARRRR